MPRKFTVYSSGGKLRARQISLYTSYFVKMSSIFYFPSFENIISRDLKLCDFSF